MSHPERNNIRNTFASFLVFIYQGINPKYGGKYLSTVAARFDQFLSNIELTPLQIDDAKTKYDGVCGKLHEHYYSNAYNGSTKQLIGSYGKNTAIAPPSDIEVLFYMPSELFSRYDSRSGNKQSQLLQDIKNVLAERYTTTSMRGDGQVVLVDFVSYKVEVVPAFQLQNGNYYIPDTNNGGKWKETSPRSEQKNITDSNKRSNGNTVKLIKLIKAWKYACNVPIKSLAIELSAVEFLVTWKYYDKTSVYYDWMVRDYFKYLLTQVNMISLIPGIVEFMSYGDSWESKAKSASERADKACSLESTDFVGATDEWKKIFGDRFYYLFG